MKYEKPSYIGSLTTVWSYDAYELTTTVCRYTTVTHILFYKYNTHCISKHNHATPILLCSNLNMNIAMRLSTHIWFGIIHFLHTTRGYCFLTYLTGKDGDMLISVFDDVDFFRNQLTVKGYLGPSKTVCKYSQMMCLS